MGGRARCVLRDRARARSQARFRGEGSSATCEATVDLKATVYDAGVFIAAEKNDRSVWAEHRVRLSAGFIPCTPAPVVAQVSRSPRQAQLRRFLRGCEVVPFDESHAHRSGALLERAKASDVVDASVVELAMARDAEILTSDPGDIERLVAASSKEVVVTSM